MDGTTDVAVRAAEIARTSYGRLVALLASRTRDLALAEDVLADAFERALRSWPESGVPDNPEGWLLTSRLLDATWLVDLLDDEQEHQQVFADCVRLVANLVSDAG